ncbi:phosphotransferase family protein [Algoriphagus jejuensis]|uniref:Phosphotransferase family protein n=1 Tax=Algoriphagus jejuensis TaxID=419934 RepID=A0ABP3Y8I7_9BACT
MGDEVDFTRLKEHLEKRFSWDRNAVEISPISGGYSNLTFLLKTPEGKFALRRPPFGEVAAKAHDMVRESQILDGLLMAGYRKSPKPILLFEEDYLIGVPFLIMEFVDGLVLRNKLPQGIKILQEDFETLSKNTLDSLIELHLLELNRSGLINLGKPTGYVSRQVHGWVDRYQQAKTDKLPEMEKVALWLKANLPQKENVGFIHNDYKYDNLVLNPQNLSEIRAVLDWEMATVGDPLMDLGTSLAYWAQADDPEILKMFNLTHLPGNLSRAEVIAYYNSRTPFDLGNILFYYVFGQYKVAVIAQQIYKRFLLGYTNDPRFGALIQVVEAAGKKAENAILTEKI